MRETLSSNFISLSQWKIHCVLKTSYINVPFIYLVDSLCSQLEPFGNIISQLAEQEGVTEDKIMLSLSELNILSCDTPSSIKLNIADIIGELCHLTSHFGTLVFK